MRKLLILSLLTGLLVSGFSFAQEQEPRVGEDNLGGFATLSRIAILPIELGGTPAFNLWAAILTGPAVGADALEYPPEYSYDYGTMKYRETDALKPPGRYPLGEYKSPDRRPRPTKHILYLPRKR